MGNSGRRKTPARWARSGAVGQRGVELDNAIWFQLKTRKAQRHQMKVKRAAVGEYSAIAAMEKIKAVGTWGKVMEAQG